MKNYYKEMDLAMIKAEVEKDEEGIMGQFMEDLTRRLSTSLSRTIMSNKRHVADSIKG